MDESPKNLYPLLTKIPIVELMSRVSPPLDIGITIEFSGEVFSKQPFNSTALELGTGYIFFLDKCLSANNVCIEPPVPNTITFLIFSLKNGLVIVFILSISRWDFVSKKNGESHLSLFFLMMSIASFRSPSFIFG